MTWLFDDLTWLFLKKMTFRATLSLVDTSIQRCVIDYIIDSFLENFVSDLFNFVKTKIITIFSKNKLNWKQNLFTVKVMIMSSYRYRRVTVPLLLQRYRDSPSATVTDCYGPFTTVTDSYWPLPNLTVPCVTSVTSVTLIFLNKTLNICSKHTILWSVTLVTQVTVKFGNDR